MLLNFFEPFFLLVVVCTKLFFCVQTISLSLFFIYIMLCVINFYHNFFFIFCVRTVLCVIVCCVRRKKNKHLKKIPPHTILNHKIKTYHVQLHWCFPYPIHVIPINMSRAVFSVRSLNKVSGKTS